MADEGLKYDLGKLRWDLLPMDCLEETVKILTFGSVKYGDNNWQKVTPFEDRYFAALMRHLVAWRSGDKIDEESKLSHMSHVMCNVLFLIWNEKHGQKSCSCSCMDTGKDSNTDTTRVVR